MYNELINILKQKNFKSMIQCVDYLYFAGYDVETAFYTASAIFPTKLHIPTLYPYDSNINDTLLLKELDECNLTINKNKQVIEYIKKGEVSFIHDIKRLSFGINSSIFTKMITNLYSAHVINNTNNINGDYNTGDIMVRIKKRMNKTFDINMTGYTINDLIKISDPSNEENIDYICR